MTKWGEFPDAEEILSPVAVATGFDRLAESLQPVIDNHDCILLGVLNGGMFPLIRLADRLQGDFRIDYCHATRYAGGVTGQTLEWLTKPRLDFRGHTVIVVDDIYDAGITLQAVVSYCRSAGAVDVITAVMVVKECVRDADAVFPDYDTGLRVPDRYVFGCGMDIYGRWRHLPSIFALSENPAGAEE